MFATVTPAWQTPATQLNPESHKFDAPHCPPDSTYAPHVSVDGEQIRGARHAPWSHGAPACGGGAQAPHSCPRGRLHHPVWHCWLTVHGAPVASGPVASTHAGGVFCV